MICLDSANRGGWGEIKIREKKRYMVFTFSTTTEAIAMEKKCKEKEIPGRLIPVPREISADCGLAWRIRIEEYQERQMQIEELKLQFQDRKELML